MLSIVATEMFAKHVLVFLRSKIEGCLDVFSQTQAWNILIYKKKKKKKNERHITWNYVKSVKKLDFHKPTQLRTDITKYFREEK